MRTGWTRPPRAILDFLGEEAFTYFEHLHGLIQGVGRGDSVGALDLQNMGILEGKPGNLLRVATDGRRAEIVEPFVETVMKAQKAGYLVANEKGEVSTEERSEPTIIVQQQESSDTSPEMEVDLGGGLVVSASDSVVLDRQYAMLVG